LAEISVAHLYRLRQSVRTSRFKAKDDLLRFLESL
jgi:hypothetical protein